MAQIAKLTKGDGPPAELGQYTLQSSAVGFIYTFSGVTYYAVIRSGPLGWVIVGGPSAVPETAVNEAFTALGAGARITLLDGTWPLAAASIAFTANQQVLEGQGRSTFIDGDALATGVHAIVLSGFTDCIVRSLSVQTEDGGGKTCHCIFIEDGADRFLIEHVIIVDSDADGIRVEGTTIDTGRILHCEILDADGIGILLNIDPANYMYRLHIEGCDIGNCAVHGISFYASAGNLYCEIVNNVVYSCTADGIFINDGDYSQIRGNICLLNIGDGIEVASTIHAQVLGNIVYSSGRHGIALVDADYCTVEGNTCVENDSEDAASYDGINVNANSTWNVLLGNVCVGNHRFGIRVNGVGNSVNSNVVAENDQHGIFINSFDCKVNDNLIYHNGADTNNAYDGIYIAAGRDRCTVNGNTVYSDGTRQRHGIRFYDDTNYCMVNGNICYNNAANGISLWINNDDNVITGNHCLSNGLWGIDIANANCLRNRVKDNILRLNGTAPFRDLGTGTQLETVPIPLIQGTTFISAVAQAWGWKIDLATEYALGVGWLPWEVQQVVRIQIKGVALAAPGAGNSMRLEITADGGTFNEGFATEPIDVPDHNSEEDSFAIGDVVSWVVDAGDDADIGHLLGGDRLQLKLLHEAAGVGDIATNTIIDSIQVEIV